MVSGRLRFDSPPFRLSPSLSKVVVRGHLLPVLRSCVKFEMGVPNKPYGFRGRKAKFEEEEDTVASEN